MDPDIFVNLAREKPKEIEKLLVLYVNHLVERVERGELARGTIRNPIKVVKLLLEDAFTDNTIFIWTDFRTRDRYITQEYYVDDNIDNLKNADIYYKFPRWRNQPVHVIELELVGKETLFGVYKNILAYLEVPIIVNKGNRGY